MRPSNTAWSVDPSTGQVYRFTNKMPTRVYTAQNPRRSERIRKLAEKNGEIKPKCGETGPPSNLCDKIGKQMGTVRHFASRNGKALFLCSTCGMGFESLELLEHHHYKNHYTYRK